MSEIVPGAAQNFSRATGLGGSYLSNYCRAGGAQFAYITRAGSKNAFIDNTIVGASNIIFQENCGYYGPGNTFYQETNCDTVPNTYQNNNFVGYLEPSVGNYPALYYAETPSIHFTGSYNNEFGIKSGTGDACGVNNVTCLNPQLASQPSFPWPGTESALDAFNAYTSNNSFYPTASSPLIGAATAISGVTTDYYGINRPNPQSIGAVEP